MVAVVVVDGVKLRVWDSRLVTVTRSDGVIEPETVGVELSVPVADKAGDTERPVNDGEPDADRVLVTVLVPE